MKKNTGGESSRKSRNIKGIVVEPFKQMKLGVYVLALCIACIGVSCWLIYSAFIEQYQHVMNIFNIIDPEIKRELVINNVFYSNAIKIGGFFAFFIGLLFWVVFRATHRFYGPIISIERFVGQISEGDYTKRVTIRRGDELQGLAIKLNQMAQILQDRHGGRVGEVIDRRKNSKDFDNQIERDVS